MNKHKEQGERNSDGSLSSQHQDRSTLLLEAPASSPPNTITADADEEISTNTISESRQPEPPCLHDGKLENVNIDVVVEDDVDGDGHIMHRSA